MQSENKICQNCHGEFTIEPEDFQFYEKIRIPPPTWCPECRLRRRLIWRNERTLYKHRCNAPGHGEEFISYIAPDKRYPVYCQKYWWSDNWDATDYGREYDFKRPFFIQLKELFDSVPRSSLSTNYQTMVNSDYSNWAGDCKNCYLTTDADYNENCSHCSAIFKSKDCWDSDQIAESELCYDSFNLTKCYRAVSSVNCRGSSDILFSRNCDGCNHCFGCTNLRNKSYHIFNIPYSKDDYFAKIEKFRPGSRSVKTEIERSVFDFWLQYPEKYLHGFANTNVSGDCIYHSKNVKHGFLAADVEDSKFIALIHSPGTKDCYDYCDWGDNVRLAYECQAVGLGANNIKFSQLVFGNCRNAEYSHFCTNCENIFGCSQLRKKQYCIFNKQYTKEEYEDLVSKIKKHMDEMPYISQRANGEGQIVYKYGEFFPPELSPFAYNESAAQEFFPITAAEAERQGWPWRISAEKQYKITLRQADIPDNIEDVPNSTLNEIIECAHGGKCRDNCATAFKIIPEELQFYRRMNLPLPQLCFFCRHQERFRFRNPLKLWHRRCQCLGNAQTDAGLTPTNAENVQRSSVSSPLQSAKYINTCTHFHGNDPCPNEFETSYAPERPEIIYCEQCYNAEVA